MTTARVVFRVTSVASFFSFILHAAVCAVRSSRETKKILEEK